MAEGHDSKAFVRHYRKIYFTLLILLIVSVLGPLIGIGWVTLITAFGIALVVFVMPPIFFFFIGTVTGGFSSGPGGGQATPLTVVAESPGFLTKRKSST